MLVQILTSIRDRLHKQRGLVQRPHVEDNYGTARAHMYLLAFSLCIFAFLMLSRACNQTSIIITDVQRPCKPYISMAMLGLHI